MAAAGGSATLVKLRANAFAGRPVPVLRATVASLGEMAQREDSVRPREVALAVLRDPMLTLTVLRHLRTHHSRRMLDDITTVEHAVMMLGVHRFFSAFGACPVVEDVLAGNAQALAGLMQVVLRARAASIYAGALAALRADAAPDQVVAAALLHDLAEMLLWCFEPERAGEIAARLKEQPGLRSAVAQQEALGFSLAELQLELARRWDLPDLILSLMDDAQAGKPRVRNVALSVALARHGAHGWRNPALPTDFDGIAGLLGVTVAEAEAHVFDSTLRVMLDRAWYGGERAQAPLPPLPRPAAPRRDGAPAEDAAARAFDLARTWLARLARGQPPAGRSRGGLVRDVGHEQLAAVAALMDGVTDGLSFGGGLFMVPEPGSARWQVLYVAGGESEGSLAYLRGDADAMQRIAGAVASRSPVAHASAAGPARPQGLFVWPVVHGGETCAVALALAPAEHTGLEPDNFQRFNQLGKSFDAALAGLDAPPYWIRAAAQPGGA